MVRTQKLCTQNNKEKKEILQMQEAHSEPSQTFKMELFTKSCILFVRLRVFKKRLNAVMQLAVQNNYRW